MSMRIWITWENQRRNHTLSSALGAKLFQFDLKLNKFVRYPVVLLKTLITFIRERPNLILVQNPSLVLSFFAVNYGRLFNTPVIVDAHNAGVYPFNGTKRWANRLAVHLFRLATFTIVTNNALAEYVESKDGRSVVLQDPIPEFKCPTQKKDLKGRFNVLFICSWASDEPYIEVIKAAELLDKTTYIYITGNSKGKEKEFGDKLPENVILTGYICEEDYIGMLYSSDVVMDLTTREDCLLCGAYEAVAMEKPIIISDTKALKEYFSIGAFYTNNTYTDIANKINIAVVEIERMKREINILKTKLISEWNKKRKVFEELLQGAISK